jgi:hypothetical protein
MTKRQPDLLWAYDLTGMVQLTLFVFCVGGAALSLAYYDMLFICAGLLSSMKYHLRTDKAAFNGKRTTDEAKPVAPSSNVENSADEAAPATS